MSSSSSSSPSEDAFVDAREVASVQLPAMNSPVPEAPVPARHERSGDEGDAKSDGDEGDEESNSDKGDEEDGDREEGKEYGDTEASEEDDGHTSDQDYENEVVEDSEPDEPPPPPPRTKSRGKVQPSPQAPPSPVLTKPLVVKRNAAAAGLAESSSSKKRAPLAARTKSLPLKLVEKKLPPPEEEAAKEEVAKSTTPKAAARRPRRKRRNNSSTKTKDSTKLSPSMNDKAAPAALEHGKEVPKSYKSPNKVRVAKPPPAPAAAAAATPSGAAEGGQVEKSARYWHLRKEVGLLEVANNNPGMLDAAFLELDEDKAAMLNNKIIRQKVAECKVKNEWFDIKKEVTKALLDTINK